MPRTPKVTSGWRAAHGKAARLGRLVVLENGRDAALPDGIVEPHGPPERDKAGRFLPGNKAGVAQRVRAGARGALATLVRQGDPAARAAMAYGRRYAAHRRTELAKLLGGGTLSSAVGGMIESEGELLAAGRYWQARSAAEANPDFARLAATLLAGSRQAARDSWELCAREADARRKSQTLFGGGRFPWLDTPDERGSSSASAPAADEQPSTAPAASAPGESEAEQ